MKPFVTTYEAMGGWKSAVLEHDHSIMMFAPAHVGLGYYETEEEAIVEAKQMARDLELPYQPRGEE